MALLTSGTVYLDFERAVTVVEHVFSVLNSETSFVDSQDGMDE